MNASEKHEQNVVDSLNAMKTMVADLESTLKNSEVSQRTYTQYMRGQNDKIELDFAMILDLQKGFRFALTDEIKRKRDKVYYSYCLFYDGLGRPNDVTDKQLEDLKAVVLSDARKLQCKLGEIQIKQENARKDRFTRIVDRVTPEVGTLKTKFLGWPIKRKAQLAESEFNVNYQRDQAQEQQQEQQAQQQPQEDEKPG
jgi:hypothetical protein